MQKLVVSTITAVVLACAIVFVLSSCTYFVKNDAGVRTSNDFAGKVVFKKIETNPIDAESHYLMGCNFQKRKKHVWAIEEFKSAVAKNPAYVEAYNRLGVSFDLIGKYGEALEAYAAALDISPDLDYVHNNLGYSYLLQGRFDLAVASFKKAISSNPENTRYRNNLAAAYAKGGQDDAAIAALTTGGDDAQAHTRMARLYYREGRYDKARAHFAEADRLKPRDDRTETGLVAAASLAEIHAPGVRISQTVPQGDPEPPKVIENRYDQDGFYTVPAVPMEDFDSSEIVVANIKETDLVAEAGTAKTPYYIAAAVPAENPAEEKVAAREPLLLNRLQLLDETKVDDLISGELEDAVSESRKRVRIEVSNGNGVRHMAREVGHFLRSKHVVLMYLSNADHFNYDRTSIYYTKGNSEEAFRLSRKLPGRQQVREVAVIREGNADISVLIGKDLKDHSSLFAGK